MAENRGYVARRVVMASEVIDILTHLRENTVAKTDSDVLQRALQLYATLVKYRANGVRLFVGEDRSSSTEFFIP